MTAVLRIHLDKEDELLYPILRERTSLEEQTEIVGGMAAHVPPDGNPEFIRWFFPIGQGKMRPLAVPGSSQNATPGL